MLQQSLQEQDALDWEEGGQGRGKGVQSWSIAPAVGVGIGGPLFVAAMLLLL